MTSAIGRSAYGNSTVRVLTVNRHDEHHELREIMVDVRLEGGLEPAFAHGNNSVLLPTDSIANTVYALAQENLSATLEEFGLELVRRFLKACPAALVACVSLSERSWEHTRGTWDVSASGFTVASPVRQLADVRGERDTEMTITGGVSDLELIKTTESSFMGFIRDRYTLMRDIEDRVLESTLAVSWQYTGDVVDYSECRSRAIAAMFDKFGAHSSKSGQHTLYQLGDAVLGACPEVVRVEVAATAHCHAPVNLSFFGRADNDQIYVAPARPHSMAHVTVERKSDG